MKRPLTMLEEAQPRNITRADVLMTEGFGLEVDGRMKRSFPTLAAAQKSALDLKTKQYGGSDLFDWLKSKGESKPLFLMNYFTLGRPEPWKPE